MSPIQNNHYCFHIPTPLVNFTSGTWTVRAGTVPGTICSRQVASNTSVKGFSFPVILPSSPTPLTGSRLISLEVDYEVTVLALTNVICYLYRVTRGEDGADAVVDAQTYSYDSNNDTHAKRSAVRKHRMTITPAVTPWIDNDQYYLFKLTYTPQVTSQFWIYSCSVNYYWRD